MAALPSHFFYSQFDLRANPIAVLRLHFRRSQLKLLGCLARFPCHPPSHTIAWQPIHQSLITNHRYGRGGGVGRILGVGKVLGVGLGLGLEVGVGVEVAVAVAVGVEVAVAVAEGVGVGVPPPPGA